MFDFQNVTSGVSAEIGAFTVGFRVSGVFSSITVVVHMTLM